MQNNTAPATVTTTTAPAKARKQPRKGPPKAPAKAATPAPKAEVRHESKGSIKQPVPFVWAFANKCKGQRRKDVLAKLDAAGVAYHTARTQYQRWFAAAPAVRKAMIAKLAK